MELFSQLEWLNVSALLRVALQEDLGQGDLTTAATVTPGQRGRAHIVVKESTRIVFCGGVLLAEVFRLAGAYPEISACAYEGNVLSAVQVKDTKLIRANAGNPRGLPDEYLDHVYQTFDRGTRRMLRARLGRHFVPGRDR